jgi:hypothetical protein
MTSPVYLGNPHDSAIWEELADEIDRAMTYHATMHSPHEGHSVIREELDELWEHVRADTGRSIEARHEAMQIAAMALRYIFDLCPSPLSSPATRHRQQPAPGSAVRTD